MSEETHHIDGASGGREAQVEALLELTIQLVSLEDFDALRPVLNGAHPADLADLMRRLDDEIRDPVFDLLEEEVAAEVLAESDRPTALAIIDDLDHQEVSDLVEEMAPDDAADVLADLEEEEAEQILGLMEASEAREVQELMAHDEETGGGIMTPDLVLADTASTVSEVIDALRKDAEDSEIYNLFVIDADERLVGIVPLHRLVTARPETQIAGLMDRDVISVTTDTDQEEIADLFKRYDLVTAPVVDEDGKVVGQITIDDVIDVIHDEVNEDIYKMAGTSDEEMENPSVLGVVRARLPWLMICLVGSFFSGAVIHTFDVTLAKVITLAAFIPAITATGGNSGLQSSTVTVRSLVTGHVSSGLLLKTIFREIGTAAVIGLACGIAASAVAWLWFGQALVGICVGAAMFLAISVAVTLGVLVPIVFDRAGVDPAIASGPFITTTNDILGLLIYLGLATILVERFL